MSRQGLVFGLLLAGLAGCPKNDPTQAAASPDSGVSDRVSAARAIEGLELYAFHGCAACHCNAGEGGCNLDAPAIQGSTRDALEANLRFATTADEFPATPDPFDPHPFKLPSITDSEIESLSAFLATLEGGAPVENDSAIARGFELYVSGSCISCHLMSGQGTNQGGIGQPIAGIDPDNVYLALAGGVPCHPLQRAVPTSSTGRPLEVCSVLDRWIVDNPTVARLTDTPPPDQDEERSLLSYFLAFVSPPPSAGTVDPCNGATGEICTAAGRGIGGYTGDQKSATDTLIYYPQNLEITDWNRDGSPDLVIDDWNNHRIRVVHLDRDVGGVRDRIITIAGDGKVTGVDALNHPTDIAFDAGGNLVIATWHNQNIYRYLKDSPPGTQRDQLAGTCDLKCAPDGPVRTTALGLPVGIDIHPDGRIFISENNCARIRVLKVMGEPERMQPDNCIDPVRLFVGSTLETLAGKNNMFGYSGEGGPARDALLNPTPGPLIPNLGISLEKGPNPTRLYVADSANNVIRYIDLSTDPPTIHLHAGVPGQSGFKDGPKEQAKFNFPAALYAHTDGAVYVADNRNHAVRKISPDGHVSTVAGTGRSGFNGDNIPAGRAQLNTPWGVVVHPDGRVFISDTNNNRVRVVRQ